MRGRQPRLTVQVHPERFTDMGLPWGARHDPYAALKVPAQNRLKRLSSQSQAERKRRRENPPHRWANQPGRKNWQRQEV